jgi:ssRNA-specific RNase YbeY (16S rRNA maturation enzyme)
VIHGTLHLTGMDDRSGRQRKRMQQREDALLARWF